MIKEAFQIRGVESNGQNKTMLKNEMFVFFFSPTRLAITNVGKSVRKQATASITVASIHRYRLQRTT